MEQTKTMHGPFECQQHQMWLSHGKVQYVWEIDMSANTSIYLNTSTCFTQPLHYK